MLACYTLSSLPLVCLPRNQDCFDNLHCVLAELIVYSIFAMDYDNDDVVFDLDAIFMAMEGIAAKIMQDLEEDVFSYLKCSFTVLRILCLRYL